ncbi:MAG: hypothetical protein M0Z41_02670 [Peptococcaceae bacterium]|nr:hypothetical protein [Peptococcaceae bacterium]
MGKKILPRHTPRRPNGQSFLAGRNLGVSLGYAIGFDAGYDKGYSEGSTLGYNNGFLQALRLLEEGGGGKGDELADLTIRLLEGLAAGGALTVAVSGGGSRAAAGLFALLGVSVRVES